MPVALQRFLLYYFKICNDYECPVGIFKHPLILIDPDFIIPSIYNPLDVLLNTSLLAFRQHSDIAFATRPVYHYLSRRRKRVRPNFLFR